MIQIPRYVAVERLDPGICFAGELPCNSVRSILLHGGYSQLTSGGSTATNMSPHVLGKRELNVLKPIEDKHLLIAFWEKGSRGANEVKRQLRLRR